MVINVNIDLASIAKGALGVAAAVGVAFVAASVGIAKTPTKNILGQTVK